METAITKYREKIHIIRGKKVMLDFDLAEFYGVKTEDLNQAMKRAKEYVKDGWFYQLTEEEWKELTTKCGGFPQTLKHRSSFPWAYSREAANFVGTRLKTPTAVERTIQIIEVFSAVEEGEIIVLPDNKDPLAVLQATAKALVIATEQILENRKIASLALTEATTAREEAAETKITLRKEVEEKIQALRDDIPIDSKERGVIWHRIRRVIDHILKKRGITSKSERASLCSKIWAHFNKKLGVRSYMDIRKKDYEKALIFLDEMEKEITQRYGPFDSEFFW